MAVLLSFGVTKIYLSDSFAAARALKKELGPDIDLLLIGEKDAVPPDDFDGGNSPLDFLERGRKSELPSTVIMVTTNGTPTLLACKNAPLTMPIAPLNLEASLKKATCRKTGYPNSMLWIRRRIGGRRLNRSGLSSRSLGYTWL